MVHNIQKEQYSHIYDIAVYLKDKSTFLPFVGLICFVLFDISVVEMIIYSSLY